MKILSLLLILGGALCVGCPVFAGELDSYRERPAQQNSLKVLSLSEGDTLEFPLYPKSQEIKGNILEQGSFHIKTHIFQAPKAFHKVLQFYKKRLGQNVDLDEAATPTGKKAHFNLIAGSQSRNVVLEELSNNQTRITFIVFEGGGAPL